MTARDIFYISSEKGSCPSCKTSLVGRIARISENDGWALIKKGADREITGCSSCLKGNDLLDLIKYTAFLEKARGDAATEKRALKRLEIALELHGLQHAAKKHGMILVPADQVEESFVEGALNER